MNERERLVAEVSANLKQRAKADPRPIRDIVEGALEREFSTAETAAIERRIDERKQRIQTLEREINDRKRELAEEKDELSRLTDQLENYQNQTDKRLDEARETLENVPKDPDNPAVENWAQKLGLTPTELLEKL